MKKLLFLLIFIALFSCKSNRETCWTCTTITKIARAKVAKPIGPHKIFVEATVITEKCNMTKKEAKEFERILTSIQVLDEYYLAVTTTECIDFFLYQELTRRTIGIGEGKIQIR